LNELAFLRCLRPTNLVICCISLLVPLQAVAQPKVDVRQTLDDAGKYFTAPLRWDVDDWSLFAGTLAVVAASHELDGRTRDHFAGDEPVVFDGKDPHSMRDAYPAAAIVAATWLYATAVDDSSGYLEGWHMLEAAGLSTVSAYALKFAAGRQRPNESTSADSWFHGGSSFPSLHATAAFAIGTVLAESGSDEWRWVRRGLGYGIGLGTAYRRLDGNVHWLSDTVAGAALGIATASFVLQRYEDHRFARQMHVTPLDRGVMFSWSMPLQ
jgi:hypothetical protein